MFAKCGSVVAAEILIVRVVDFMADLSWCTFWLRF
jgi:hypothetical protein